MASMSNVKNSYWNWLAIACIAYVIASFFASKGMFIGEHSDGFYSQISYVHDNPYEVRLTALVHWLRYIVVYPFWWLYENGFSPYWQSLVLLLYMAPLLLPVAKDKASYLRLVVLLLPFFVSYRTCLLVVSITLLFYYISFFLSGSGGFILSAALANLSSGVVLAWLAVIVLNRKQVQVEKKAYFFCFFVLGLGLSTSVMQKVSFFDALVSRYPVDQRDSVGTLYNGEVGNKIFTSGISLSEPVVYAIGSASRVVSEVSHLYETLESSIKTSANLDSVTIRSEASAESAYGYDLSFGRGKLEMTDFLSRCENVLCKAVARNTLIVSYKSGRIDRFLVYVGLLLSFTVCLVICLFTKRPESSFFLISLVGFLFEGLWPISFSLASMIFLASFLECNFGFFASDIEERADA